MTLGWVEGDSRQAILKAMKRRPALVALLAPSALLALIVALAATAPIEQARGAFPGRNGKIAYTVGRLGADSLFTMRPDGSAKRRVAPGAHDPAFSPTGKKIAFERNGNIWTMRANGSHVRRLTHGPAEDSAPSFSPSGKRLVFFRFVFDKIDALYTIRADGSHLRRLPKSEGLAQPQFSPNGRWIVASGCGIVIMRARASHPHPRSLTHGTCGRFRDSNPDFSPNGHRIAFERIANERGGIWVMRLDGSDKTRIHAGGRNDHQPAFSPNGRRIAFMINGAIGKAIYTMRTDGADVVRLTRADGLADAPSWGVRP